MYLRYMYYSADTECHESNSTLKGFRIMVLMPVKPESKTFMAAYQDKDL